MDIKSDAFYLELTESGNIIHKICWADSFFIYAYKQTIYVIILQILLNFILYACELVDNKFSMINIKKLTFEIKSK